MHQDRNRRSITFAVCPIVIVALLSAWYAREQRQQDLNHAFIAAIKQQDAAEVNAVLAAGADVHVLLAHGANANCRDNAGHTPLSIAQSGGRTDFAKILKAHGATQ